jgi:hypothetical protein
MVSAASEHVCRNALRPIHLILQGYGIISHDAKRTHVARTDFDGSCGGQAQPCPPALSPTLAQAAPARHCAHLTKPRSPLRGAEGVM